LNRIIRNLCIFTVATVGGGLAGVALELAAPSPNRMQGLGILLLLASPLAANLVLRGVCVARLPDAALRRVGVVLGLWLYRRGGTTNRGQRAPSGGDSGRTIHSVSLD
jgi:hypothetical protein